MSFPHPQPPEGFVRQLEAWKQHDTLDRLHEITVPTMVVAGEIDIVTRPATGRSSPRGSRAPTFVVLPGEAHQPFQESPEAFNAMVDAFWSSLEPR